MKFIKGNKINKGRIKSEETKKRMSDAAKNRPKISEETRQKMSKSRKNYLIELQKLGLIKHNPFKHSGGYVVIHCPENSRADSRGRIFEHIVIWEKIYNKRLPKGYLIHHLNGIKDDNRPENLMALKKGEHVNYAEPYKKRIRELEIEIGKLKQRDLFNE